MAISLVIAGGSGNRMHQDIPKQFLTVNERPVIIYTLEAFQNHPEIDTIAVVCIAGWEQVLWAYAKQFNITKLKYVIGLPRSPGLFRGYRPDPRRHTPNGLSRDHLG